MDHGTAFQRRLGLTSKPSNEPGVRVVLVALTSQHPQGPRSCCVSPLEADALQEEIGMTSGGHTATLNLARLKNHRYSRPRLSPCGFPTTHEAQSHTLEHSSVRPWSKLGWPHGSGACGYHSASLSHPQVLAGRHSPEGRW